MIKSRLASTAYGGVQHRAAVRSSDEFGALARDLNLFLDRINRLVGEPDEVLRVSARHLRGDLGLAAFACRVERPGVERPLLEGNLSVYVVEHIEELATRSGGILG